MKDLINNIKKDGIANVIIQFVKFGLVGASNTIISLMTYYVLVYCNVNYLLSNTIGFVLGTLNAYYWNNKYVFKKEDNEERSTIKSCIKVFISYGVTFIINTLLLILWVDVLNISDLIAPIINLIVTVPINFLLNKLWAFK